MGEVCAERQLDVEQIRREIATLDPSEAEEQDWSAEPLAAIVEHILARYHRPLQEELPRLRTMAQKVVRAHGASFPEMIPPLQQRLSELADDLETHMMKEERVLFPYIAALEAAAIEGRSLPRSPFGTVANPIAAMEADHDEAGRRLAEMHRLTGGYQLPEGACNTFRALFHGLAELEREMHLHVHLENNVLFPRAAEMEGGMG